MYSWQGNSGLTRDEVLARMDDIVAFAEIGDALMQPVRVYSSGMMVRLAFATATAVRPDLLIVDEALAGGRCPCPAINVSVVSGSFGSRA